MAKRKINTISLPRLNNGAHIEYASVILASVQSQLQTEAEPLIAGRIAAFAEAVAAEERALKISAKSLVTDGIEKADDDRCALYIGYKKAVAGFRNVTDTGIAQAVKVLNQHISDYAIKVKSQRDQKTGLLAHFIDDLEGKYADHVAALGLTVIVNCMKEANERIRTLIRQRNNERMGIAVGALRKARVKTDAAYHDLIDMVNALAFVNGGAAYEPFIDYVNTEIARYKCEVLNQKASATDTSADEVMCASALRKTRFNSLETYIFSSRRVLFRKKLLTLPGKERNDDDEAIQDLHLRPRRHAAQYPRRFGYRHQLCPSAVRNARTQRGRHPSLCGQRHPLAHGACRTWRGR